MLIDLWPLTLKPLSNADSRGEWQVEYDIVLTDERPGVLERSFYMRNAILSVAADWNSP